MAKRSRGMHKRRRDAVRALETALRDFLTSDSDDEARLRGARMNATHAGVSPEQIRGVFDRETRDFKAAAARVEAAGEVAS